MNRGSSEESPVEGRLIIDLTPALIDSMSRRTRKLGRYSSSEIYKMLESHKLPWGLKPQDFFEPEVPDFTGAYRMQSGIKNHELVQQFLKEGENEVKKEYIHKVEGIERFTLVGKADHLTDIAVYEIKTSDEVMAKSKPWQEHQTKLYCSLFERPIGYILQPLIEDNHLILREVGRVERDDVWFAKEMGRLLNYHERLEAILKEKEYAGRTTTTGAGQ